MKQNKNQEKAIRLQTEAMKKTEYMRSVADYTEMFRSLFYNGLGIKIYDDLHNQDFLAHTNWTYYSENDKLMYQYLEVNYEIIEHVYTLQREGWISQEIWACWENWIHLLIQHPLFTDVHRDNLGLFDFEFQSHITNLLEKSKNSPLVSQFDVYSQNPYTCQTVKTIFPKN